MWWGRLSGREINVSIFLLEWHRIKFAQNKHSREKIRIQIETHMWVSHANVINVTVLATALDAVRFPLIPLQCEKLGNFGSFLNHIDFYRIAKSTYSSLQAVLLKFYYGLCFKKFPILLSFGVNAAVKGKKAILFVAFFKIEHTLFDTSLS